MRRALLTLATLAVASPALHAQQEDRYDYWRPQRDMVQYGQQAILMCNGLFTSNRTLEQVFDQELAYLRQPVGTARGGDYVVDRERKAVAIGAPGGTPVMRAVFREGLGEPDKAIESFSAYIIP